MARRLNKVSLTIDYIGSAMKCCAHECGAVARWESIELFTRKGETKPERTIAHLCTDHLGMMLTERALHAEGTVQMKYSTL